MDGETEAERDDAVPLVQVDRWALVLQCPQETPCKNRRETLLLHVIIISFVMIHMTNWLNWTPTILSTHCISVYLSGEVSEAYKRSSSQITECILHTADVTIVMEC